MANVQETSPTVPGPQAETPTSEVDSEFDSELYSESEDSEDSEYDERAEQLFLDRRDVLLDPSDSESDFEPPEKTRRDSPTCTSSASPSDNPAPDESTSGSKGAKKGGKGCASDQERWHTAKNRTPPSNDPLLPQPPAGTAKPTERRNDTF
ncbi:hypothetical protein WMY93_008374 [Mugilogobius chulae]|uniref:Uncharacterized protein n=1 Tax=Mugilogobius chulae TaxID=88201 RepID=A0AAW0PM82_9GOBI